MDYILIGLQVAILLGIGSIFLFKKCLFSYSSEKGKNLATKEDIGEITRKVEEVKAGYITEIERLKVDLSLLSRKNNILLDEKIRVFKKLQKRLVDFKKYCEAALGSYDDLGEFHPNLNVLAEGIDKAALQHITALHEIEQEDFIFLSKKSRGILAELHHSCSMMCSMELAVFGEEAGSEMAKSTIPVYESAMINIDSCLQSLYEELEFPSREE
ncbi:hypothetical protein LZ659_14520 [Shewanella indica]|jgi:hypothetical protein|uniref:hypothetical protein n=1 Tax=Shewanella TaxID=22 RepID=UPI001F41A8D3|nr:hypothetical protein [Shewanella indica]MCE9792818.1 hypothetical protein [Shewanella indica]